MAIEQLPQPDKEAAIQVLEEYLERAKAGEIRHVIVLAENNDGTGEHRLSPGMRHSKACWLCMKLMKWIQEDLL